MKRGTPKKKKKVAPDLGLLGGHMPDPPEDCAMGHCVKRHRGRLWIDNAICSRCQFDKVCWRRVEFMQAWKEWHREKRAENGM